MGRCVSLICLVLLLAIDAHPLRASAAGWEMRICAEAQNLPFSHRSGTGFENRLADILAEELEATLTWIWISHPIERAAAMRRGDCDIVMGVPDGHRGLLTTIAYYRSTYVFAYPFDSGFEVSSFDDDVLRNLKVGLAFDGRGTSPPAQALINRGLADRIEYVRRSRGPIPGAPLIAAVAHGEVDLAIEWGPVAAFSARRQSRELSIIPVSPEIALPFVPMVFPITMGVRPGDVALRDRLNVAVANRWDDIQSVLGQFGVPLLDLPRPKAVAAENH